MGTKGSPSEHCGQMPRGVSGGRKICAGLPWKLLPSGGFKWLARATMNLAHASKSLLYASACVAPAALTLRTTLRRLRCFELNWKRSLTRSHNAPRISGVAGCDQR